MPVTNCSDNIMFKLQSASSTTWSARGHRIQLSHITLFGAYDASADKIEWYGEAFGTMYLFGQNFTTPVHAMFDAENGVTSLVATILSIFFLFIMLYDFLDIYLSFVWYDERTALGYLEVSGTADVYEGDDFTGDIIYVNYASTHTSELSINGGTFQYKSISGCERQVWSIFSHHSAFCHYNSGFFLTVEIYIV